jgi:hypothetical protein
VVILAIAFSVTLLAFLQSLNAYTGETEIAQVRVLDVRDGRMKLEILPREGDSVIAELDGQYFAPVVRVVIFDDYAVFLGAKSWYRFEGITSFDLDTNGSETRMRQQNTDFYFPETSRMSSRLWDLYERYDARIPGVRTVQVEMDLKRVRDKPRGRELTVYSLRIQNDGGLQIVEVY